MFLSRRLVTSRGESIMVLLYVSELLYVCMLCCEGRRSLTRCQERCLRGDPGNLIGRGMKKQGSSASGA